MCYLQVLYEKNYECLNACNSSYSACEVHTTIPLMFCQPRIIIKLHNIQLDKMSSFVA